MCTGTGDKYLLRSLQVAGRMERLIQEMLGHLRMENTPEAFRPEPLELSSLLKNQLALDKDLALLRNQRITTDLADGLAVEADSALLSKAVENILSNAFLYSPEGARIRVWCGLIQDQPAFAVENSGVHIPEEALPHLFEAFYRIESSRSRSTGGSGLGLCLTKMILDRHKASCTVENTEGGVQGSCPISRLILSSHKTHINYSEIARARYTLCIPQYRKETGPLWKFS